MTRYHRLGGRTIELFVPIEHLGGKKITEIAFGPIRFDHTLRWQEGQLSSVLTLMAEVSGLDEVTLRQLAYPDADRVMEAFISMLPPEIRENLGGRVTPPPTPIDDQPKPPTPQQEFPDGPDPGGTGMNLDG